MSAAAAEIGVQRRHDFLARRLSPAADQFRRRHDDSGQAVATLAGLEIDECALQRMRPVECPQAFNGRDRFALDGSHWQFARALGMPVNQHRARTAASISASEARPLEM